MGDPTVRLRGILPQTASSASVRPDGSLVVEIFDWSTEAEQWLGREAAYFMILAPPEKDRVLATLLREAGDGAPEGEADHRLLDLVQQRFADYYEAKRWLDAAGIPYAKDFDGMA
ncbi:MAG: hypothetical protein IPI38_07580 [Gemmatimonadetes bacterium]|jgi:hypothetical protein|nr:hypothetical protein [Gemmatimonadota bacterium]MBP6669629.1 hypothetical protein [Gemmatimonadales bacterium]MBK7351294.1 hypothetical protein [Gemmatimonadota bacterium]MBK7715269.1 hypothetical protein [Gemmatimonadota bacterium]MBK7786455.1 hypothetical protein [Gemmatimonadota bacterium]